MPPALDRAWALDAVAVAKRLGSGERGLTRAEAAERLARHGPNDVRARRDRTRLAILVDQFANALIVLLLFAAVTSAVTGEWTDAAIVLIIVVTSAAIGYHREARAANAAAALRSRLQIHASVVRGGEVMTVAARELVPGDVVALAAGSLVPADVRLIEATDLFVNEAVLTGESFPVEKRVEPDGEGAPLAARRSCAWLGSNVRSGSGRGVVIATGAGTEVGHIAGALAQRPPETEFERSLRRFGYLLTVAMLVVVIAVFAINVLLDRPPVDTLLFSIALAVGLSPELLPAILAVNLSRGSQNLARHGVLVRRLGAIENLGSMDVLCTDKTGTLTEGVVRLDGAYDDDGRDAPRVRTLASLNAALHTGLANPLDQAILDAQAVDRDAVEKLAEVPYDFVRKRLTVIVRDSATVRAITKGAFEQVLAACTQLADGGPLDDEAHERLRRRYLDWTGAGVRVLGVATRILRDGEMHDRSVEHDMRFEGFLTFIDRPKAGVRETIARLAGLGVKIKLITGDSERVARHVAREVGLSVRGVLTGAALGELHDDALPAAVESVDLFAEVDPNQKERIIRALRQRGHVVGFLGDGVNDAPAMHAADTSISVDDAVDVAKEAAELVAFERDLDVIARGVEEGRRTFANTLKYVLTTTSANLGNMMSMAVASLVLPFLPLTAGQILLNNLLSDIPAIGIAGDRVDADDLVRPRRWHLKAIGRFMLQFGLLSSLFDILTFVVLLRGFDADARLFQTGWFVESLLTELVIALVVRTRQPLMRSRPGPLLLTLTVIMIPLTIALPYVPGSFVLGFVAPPPLLALALVAITALYVVSAELLKRWTGGGT